PHGRPRLTHRPPHERYDQAPALHVRGRGFVVRGRSIRRGGRDRRGVRDRRGGRDRRGRQGCRNRRAVRAVGAVGAGESARWWAAGARGRRSAQFLGRRPLLVDLLRADQFAPDDVAVLARVHWGAGRQRDVVAGLLRPGLLGDRGEDLDVVLRRLGEDRVG